MACIQTVSKAIRTNIQLNDLLDQKKIVAISENKHFGLTQRYNTTQPNIIEQKTLSFSVLRKEHGDIDQLKMKDDEDGWTGLLSHLRSLTVGVNSNRKCAKAPESETIMKTGLYNSLSFYDSGKECKKTEKGLDRNLKRINALCRNPHILAVNLLDLHVIAVSSIAVQTTVVYFVSTYTQDTAILCAYTIETAWVSS